MVSLQLLTDHDLVVSTDSDVAILLWNHPDGHGPVTVSYLSYHLLPFQPAGFLLTFPFKAQGTDPGLKNLGHASFLEVTLTPAPSLKMSLCLSSMPYKDCGWFAMIRFTWQMI